MLVWTCIDTADGGLSQCGEKSNCWKIRLRVITFGMRNELNDVDAHENSSDTAMTTRPTTASEIRQAVIGFSPKNEMCGMIAVCADHLGREPYPDGAACGA
jgi:hypothetical protein